MTDNPCVVATLLTDDLWIEILSRLPTKSLQRFQCVSKLWRTFISYVSSQRRLRVLLPLSGFFLYRDDYYSDDKLSGFFVPTSLPPAPLEDFESRMKTLPVCTCLLHCCNGLMLFGPTPPYPGFYYVWNPTTMEFRALPRRHVFKGSSICSLVYDPRQSPHYTMVRFSVGSIYPCIYVDIYSSTTNTWDRSEIPRVPSCALHHSSVFYKGSLHMLSQSRAPENPDHLIRFDIQKKTACQLIRLPEKRPDVYKTACVGESSGHLYYGITLEQELHIYRMIDEDGELDRWLLTHKTSTKFFDHHPLTCCEPDGTYPRPIAFHPESELVYLSMPSKILSYHPNSGRLEEVCSFTDRRSEKVFWTMAFPVIPCMKSLYPPGGKFINESSLEKYV